MMSSFSIEKILPEKYTDKNWEDYFLLRTKVAECTGDSLPFESWWELKERSLKLIADGEGIYLVHRNKKEAGYFIFDIWFKEQPNKRYVYFRNGLLDQVLNDDFLKTMFAAFLEFDTQAQFLAIKSKDGVNDFIENKLKGQVRGNVEYSELVIKDAKLKIIENWYFSSSEKFPNYTIKFYEDIPDDLLKEYCTVFTELLFDMPVNSELGDFNITVDRIKKNQENGKKQNHCSYRYLVFNEHNKLIAKTNVAVNKNKPQVMRQYMTGVLKDYRGQGISKWLKSAMFKKLVADFPSLEKLETDTHPENIASKELSKQMGFKKKGFRKEFLIEKKYIKHFVTSSNVEF